MKKVGFFALIIWFFGAVVMSLYYQAERRKNCIDEEGFLKGVLWCSTDPKTGINVSGQHIHHLLKGLLWPFKLVQGKGEEEADVIDKAQEKWLVDGSMVRLDRQISKDGVSVSAVILINFDSKNNCSPEFGSLAAINGKLGNPISQDRSTKHLIISVDKRSPEMFTSVYTEYANGFEYAIYISETLVKEMSNGKTLIVGVSDRPSSQEYSLSGFADASAKASKNCINNNNL